MKLYDKFKNYNRPLYFVINSYKHNSQVKLCLELKDKNKIKIKYVNLDTNQNIKIKARKVIEKSFCTKLLTELGFLVGRDFPVDDFIIIKCHITEPSNSNLGCLCNNSYDEIMVISPDFFDTKSYRLFKYTVFNTGVFTKGYYEPYIFRFENIY
jgi:hypothetical protein